ncbi:tRNA pseudouridine(55) synthase TruB [Hazenella coriacea]|uniref:tRNA pseudouridine synthase B n=1 Tax=Hazenella coriacea TaxID=1179467 RepID=A0A4R3L2M3_9BACL|nr:tRNA pseudouridine(55) synthase TruB [Hazenella coriacea]TCS92551.1 tRNA pseudouridine55 synthase [Hazenella coriacea]
MKHGIIPVYKPRGLTSHDVVGKIRRLAGQKRVGHTGTLDPEVEGVLPICLGQATRLVEYIQELPKRYKGSLLLGTATDTEDQTGKVIEEVDVVKISQEEVEEVFSSFLGTIEQVPPMYSAVKVGGKRLYDLARQGVEVKRPSRQVTIYQLHCTRVTQGKRPQIDFDVVCSKGTYVRTLCVDIGRALGYPAHMASLIRTESGPFRTADCFTFSELELVAEKGSWEEVLTPLDAVLGHFPSVILEEEDALRALDGWSLQVDFEKGALSHHSLVRVYSESGRFCGLYRLEEPLAKPEKVFRDVDVECKSST